MAVDGVCDGVPLSGLRKSGAGEMINHDSVAVTVVPMRKERVGEA